MRCSHCRGPVRTTSTGALCLLCGPTTAFDPATLGFVDCPECGGDGDPTPGAYRPDASSGQAPYSKARTCRDCGGSGLVPSLEGAA